MDAILSHGVAFYLKEKLLDTSDAYSTFVCDKCGLFATRMNRKDNMSHSSAKDIYFCPACKNYTEISKVMIPYSFKLLCQELMACSIVPRLFTKKDIFDQ